MLGDFARALGQLADRRIRGVIWRGVGLAFLMLLIAYAAIGVLLHLTLPASVEIPFFGPVGFVDDLFTGLAFLSLTVMSVFLMIPVAALFTGLFLEQVADAVEAVHYPHLPPPAGLGFRDALKDSVNFLGVIIAANALGLVVAALVGPAAPLVFYGINGYLLGREYFQLVAARRLGRDGARALRRRHAGQIWLAGTLMAVPLTVPILNLFIPVLGVATFTHTFHRLNGSAAPGR